MNKIIFGILISAAVFLLLWGAIGNFYAWDYFSLWGIHAKIVWATGSFWIGGAETPLNFSYESILGSVWGGLAHIFSPQKFPDAGLGFFNTLLCVLMFAITTRFYFHSCKNEKSVRLLDIAVLVFLFLFLDASAFGQNTFGAYADLIASFPIALYVLSLRQQNLRATIFSALAIVLLKPIYWVWPAIVLIAMFFEILSQAKIKKQLSKIKFLAINVIVLMLVVQVQAFLFRGDIQGASLLQGSFKGLSMGEVASFLYAFLSTHGFLMVLCGAYAVYAWKKERFWSFFTLGGCAYLAIVYFYLFSNASLSEKFQSIARYTFPLVVTFIFYFAQQRYLQKTLRLKELRLKAFQVVFLFVLIFKAYRDYPRIMGAYFTWKTDFNLCLRNGAACAEAERLRAETPPATECNSYRMNTVQEASLKDLVISYQLLPIRIYFAKSQIPKHLSPTCDL